MTPTTRAELVAAIGAIADQIDRHYGNPPGTAIRGIYFGHWSAAECEHQTVALYLADAVVNVAERTGFALQSFIDDERAAALKPDEPGGMA